MSSFYSYLDDFSRITILVPIRYRDDFVKSFTVVGPDETIELEILSSEIVGNERKYITRFDGYILLNHMYHIKDDRGTKSELFTGKIVRTDLFDDIYYYEESDLGSSYRRDRTKFKIWTPVAKDVKLELLSPSGEHEIVPMEYDNQGVWYLRLKGDYEGYRYRYISYVNGKEHTLTDPYAISSTANGQYSYVIDTAKLYKMTQQRPRFSGVPTDAVLYEASVRDLTKSTTVSATHPGKYASFTEPGLTTNGGNPAGFDHIKELGITHIQLMPVYDFASIDESDPNAAYNWGYDPGQYNVPEGSYSLDPEDPYERINELRKLVDDIHGAGFRVTMDVVYNHVYNHKAFPFEKIIPGYGYRFDDQGMMTDSSGCGNDVATERRMVRKFIIDSVMFWAKEFKMDGFRFDLMGLIDIRTMNTLRQKLDRFRNDIIVYGEGWRIPTVVGDDMAAHMYNKHLLFNIGHFNDKTRELIKGATFDLKQKGYALGSNARLNDIKNILLGSCLNKFLFRYPTQSINYVECHDNNTFYDKALAALPEAPEDERKARQLLASTMVILAQGVPFLHLGQEFYRSKQGVENSYKSPDAINMVDWDLLDQNIEDVAVIKEMIRLRRKYDLFRLTTPSKIQEAVTVHVESSGTIRYELREENTSLLVIFKNNTEPETFALDGRHTLIFDGRKKSRRLLTKINVEDIGTYILKRK